MRITRGFVLGIVGVATLVGAGCSKQATPAAPQTNPPPVETNTNQDPAAIEEGNREASEAVFGAQGQQIPSNFPSDVPRKPGAVFVGFQQANGVVVTATFRGIGTVTEWTTYYKRAIAAAGWKILSSYTVHDTTMLNASKAQRTITLTIAKNEQNLKEVAAIFLFGVATPRPSLPSAPSGSMGW